METRIRIFLQSTLILVALGIGVQVSAQPEVVTDVPDNSTGFVTIGDLVYFRSGDELWRTDGTEAGTIFLAGGFNQPNFFTEFNGAAYFRNANNSELWKSDGTPDGTVRLYESGNNELTILGKSDGSLFFHAYDAATGLELYRTDGTAAGTIMLKDINPGAASSIRGPSGHMLGNQLIFSADNGTNGIELWRSDGTSAGTVMIEDINPGPEHSIYLDGSFFVYNDLFYFMGITDEHGAEPWVSDGTSDGTHLLKDINPGAAPTPNVQFAIGNDGYLYFLLLDDYDGNSAALWKTAGTDASTSFIKTVGVEGVHNTFHSFLIYHDKVHFFNRWDFFSDDLWQSDGTAEGTYAFAGFETMDGGLSYFDEVNDYLIFTGSFQAYPTPFYRTNGGSAEEFYRLKSKGFHSGDRSVIDPELTTVGDLAFFADHDGPSNDDSGAPESEEDYFHLMQTDGFTTQSMRTLHGVSTIGTEDVVNFNGKVIFTTHNDQYGSSDTRKYIWIYDPEDANTDPGECTASGSILRESWDGVQGSRVSDIPVNSEPSQTSQLSIFEGPTNAGTHYGARIHGYICPPETGDYTFWIASNDHSELWLSTDESTGNRVRIAYVEGATGPRQWNKFASQKSAPIPLVAGQRYYIMALHKQGVGTDNLAVGWQLPDGTMERPIAGARLSPYEESASNTSPIVRLTSPEDGQAFTEPATILIQADASDADGSITKVEFYESANKIGEDLTAPYELTWTDVPAGTYNLMVVATDNEGFVSNSDHISITVQSGCMASGTITREYWGGVEGSQVSDVPVNSPPTSVSELTIFEGPSNVGIHYGSRIRGYICPPETGDYTFYISSNDHSELWLSTDADPANKVRIAWVTGATGERQWNKFASQQSMPVALTQGQTYYIEAIHKQGVGSDHLAVGWQIPGGTFERPIPGSRLSPFEMNDAARMASAAEEESEKKTLYSQLGIYPNPVQRGSAELRMAGYEGISETVETQVEIISLTGEVIYAERIRCGGDCGTYLMNINQELMPGLYMVNLRTNGARFSKRLLVK